MRVLKIIFVASLLFLLAGMMTVYADGSKDIKEKCPTCQSAKIDKNLSVEYEGKTYYFCCDGCKTAFEKNPAKYVKANLDKEGKKCQDGSKCCDSKKEAKGKTCPSKEKNAKETSAMKSGPQKACCEAKKM